MTIDQIKATQKQVGVDDDGFWGPLSTAGARRYLLGLMPNPNPWPATDEESLNKFYGRPGDESQLISIVPSVPLKFEGKQIKTLLCHRKVAASLNRALVEAYRAHPEIVEIYDGCYNNRSMRGGSRPSLHARGAAIDLDAEHNGNTTHWPVAARMPLAIMVAFAREGWTPAGAFWNRDAMHFQATKP